MIEHTIREWDEIYEKRRKKVAILGYAAAHWERLNWFEKLLIKLKIWSLR